MLLVHHRDCTSDSCFHWNKAILPGASPIALLFWHVVLVSFFGWAKFLKSKKKKKPPFLPPLGKPEILAHLTVQVIAVNLERRSIHHCYSNTTWATSKINQSLHHFHHGIISLQAARYGCINHGRTTGFPILFLMPFFPLLSFMILFWMMSSQTKQIHLMYSVEGWTITIICPARRTPFLKKKKSYIHANIQVFGGGHGLDEGQGWIIH